MPHDRDVQVHLLPDLAPPGRLTGSLAVVIDVLRSTTTMIHALASGCTAVRPCLEVDEARELAGQMRAVPPTSKTGQQGQNNHVFVLCG